MTQNINTEFSFEQMINFLKKKINFTYARYGDGELNAILKKTGQNCDGHEYFPDMGKALHNIVKSAPTKQLNYFCGLQNLGKTQNEDNMVFQEFYKLNIWSNNEILTRASLKGRLRELKEAVHYRNVIQIGNSDLIDLKIANKFISIPKKNCWMIHKQLTNILLNVVKRDDIILYSASMPSKVVIDILYNKYGNDITQIDCGSVFDPYVGNFSRTYMNNLPKEYWVNFRKPVV